MSKCNICGADLAPGAKFCTGCGTPVPQDLNPAPAEQPSFQQTPNQNGSDLQQAPSQNTPDLQQASAQAAPAPTAFQQAVSSSAGNPTAFEQAVSSNNAPKNIYSDVPQYGQPDSASRPAAGQPAGVQPGFNGQPPVGGQPDFNGQPPVGGQPGANSFYYGQPPMQPQKKKTGLIAGIVAAVVAALAIIIILIVVLSTRNTYKTPIEKFEKGINNRDTSTLMEAFPLNPEHPSLYKIAGESVGDYVLDDFDSEFDGQKIKIEITGKEKLTQLQLSNAEDSIYASLYGSDYKLTSGYRVYCTISVIGDDSYEPEDSTITVCKLNGKWYIFGID